jgi:hypothetical protein
LTLAERYRRPFLAFAPLIKSTWTVIFANQYSCSLQRSA